MKAAAEVLLAFWGVACCVRVWAEGGTTVGFVVEFAVDEGEEFFGETHGCDGGRW